ncbi:odorant receptor Or1-like [Diachasmimorpha longicaudata]|uniref:odorant receptor Or1-like n=1 Tax=Diachasmimorpha longicaudata TaxID=58733 RepID=UPI0030B8D4BB
MRYVDFTRSSLHHSTRCTQEGNMESLRNSFLLLQYCGMWPSHHWSPNSFKFRIYSLYTFCILAMINAFVVSELFCLSAIRSIEDFADNCFMLMSMAAASGKGIIILMMKDELITVLNALDHYPHKPMHVDEENIQNMFTRRIRLIFILYAGQLEIGVWFMSIFVYLQKLPFGVLPYKAWIPWDYSAPKMYWFLYWFQMISVIIGANVVSASDTLISGFMILICGQLNILKCRLERVIEEFGIEADSKSKRIRSDLEKICERRITACVEYHCAIFEMATKINSLFSIVIFLQYTASSIILCVSVLIMSQIPVSSPKFMSLFSYVWCMILEIFMLCASGNTATIECENLNQDLYCTKWHRLTNRTEKYLLLLMARTLRPIVFVSGHIVVLSLESFAKLLKLSYSVYTVLQHSMK